MKIDWYFVICNMLFFSVGYFIQQREINNLKIENSNLRNLVEAKFFNDSSDEEDNDD